MPCILLQHLLLWPVSRLACRASLAKRYCMQLQSGPQRQAVVRGCFRLVAYSQKLRAGNKDAIGV